MNAFKFFANVQLCLIFSPQRETQAEKLERAVKLKTTETIYRNLNKFQLLNFESIGFVFVLEASN